MKRLLVRVGGSHRKLSRQHRAFAMADINLVSRGAAVLGSKYNHAIMEDTEAARKLLKEVGGTVAKKQWKWLSKD